MLTKEWFLRSSFSFVVLIGLITTLGGAVDRRAASAMAAAPADALAHMDGRPSEGGRHVPALAPKTFTLALGGIAEVNDSGAIGQGDPDGGGSATITLNTDTSEVCFTITVRNLTLPATAAHIHRAPWGLNGPAVVTLLPPDATGRSSGCVVVTTTLLTQLASTPSSFYVNVHTSDFPNGAVRGQLSGKLLRVALSGGVEVSDSGQINMGDLNGRGLASITLDAAHGDVCWVMRTTNVTVPATFARILRGVAGLNGPAVVLLSPPDATGLASGCRAVTTSLIDEMVATPSSFYVNVYTNDFPKGAVRGQMAGVSYRSTLNGHAEMSDAGEPDQGDPDGRGSATVTIDAVHGDVCWVMRTSRLTLPATAAHIHHAQAGLNGPVVVTLAPPDTTGVSTGCVTAAATLLSQIRLAPGDYYLNIHTSDFVNGALRGQLVGTSYHTALGGSEELSDTGATKQGDLDGTGLASITLDPASARVCWVLRVSNITLPATAAHIHRAQAGINGPAVVELSAPDASGMASGCRAVPALLINQMAATPASFYVNVHTEDFPNGAVRAQLAGLIYRRSLDGEANVSSTGVPDQGDRDGRGSAVITVDPVNGDICWVLRTSNIALPATYAFLHRGPAGLNGPAVVLLSPPDATGFASGCRASTTTLLNQIRNTLATFYVSVRTSEFPNGALRGQLGGATFRATLTGEAEVSATGEPGQGDLDASGSATLTVDAPHGDICWVLRAADIALPASDAHVHQGVAGSNGSAVITLSPPDATGLSTGCVAAPTALLNQIRISPADFYVNIHTSEFPNGAVRGQLAR